VLRIVLYLTDSDRVAAFEASSHTKLAESGKDIACAGASSIIQTTLMGLDKLIKMDFGLQQEEGYIYFCLPQEMNPGTMAGAQLLLKTMILGLEKLEEQYPKNIRISREFLKSPGSRGIPEEKKYRSGGVDLMTSELENLELKPRKRDFGPYTLDKLFGVALLGAVSGLIVYYIYNQLGEDTKSVVKETIVSTVRRQIASLGQVDSK